MTAETCNLFYTPEEILSFSSTLLTTVDCIYITLVLLSRIVFKQDVSVSTPVLLPCVRQCACSL